MISWQTVEFEKKNRHPDWIWYTGLSFAIVATIAFFYGDIFFGIFIILSGILLIVFALREPQILSITLEEKLVRINEETIPYERIEKFWIDETEKPDKLLLLVRGSIVPVRALRLESIDAATVRSALTSKISESFVRESFGVKIFERLGF